MGFVFALPVLLVAFTVVAAGYLLVVDGSDPQAAQALRVTAVVLLLLIVTNLILLVGTLGIHAVMDTAPAESRGTDATSSESTGLEPRVRRTEMDANDDLF